MRLGKYRLFEIVKTYNGDTFSFLSKNRRTLKIIRYENHKVILYDISYERGYSFMKPVLSDGQLWYQLDFKYLVALLNCSVHKEFEILRYAKAADGHRQDDHGIPLFECLRD